MSDGPFDLAVVGGGLIGAAAALGAARLGRRVVLLDRARPQYRAGRLGMDIRNVSLSPASRSLLESLGAWPAGRPAPFVGMRVWEEQGTERIEFNACEVGRCELGWIAENGPLLDALWQALEAHDKVTLELGAGLEGIAESAAGLELSSANKTVEARLLVGADGARSAVRALSGVATATYPTGHHALVTVARAAQSHDGVALQRFLLDGPLALLPAPDPHLVSVVWSQAPAAAERRVRLGEDEFAAELGAAVEHQLGVIEAVDERFAFPLSQHLVASFNPAPRILLLGDAARALHPLAGLGANVGFEDVRDFLALLKRLPGAAEPASPGIRNRFARQRRTRSLLMLGAMTALRQVYAEADPYLQWLRILGVSLSARSAPLKRQVIREALGLGPVAAPW